MLLGAVTLPTVFISKLVQMSRALSLDGVRHEGILVSLSPYVVHFPNAKERNDLLMGRPMLESELLMVHWPLVYTEKRDK